MLTSNFNQELAGKSKPLWKYVPFVADEEPKEDLPNFEDSDQSEDKERKNQLEEFVESTFKLLSSKKQTSESKRWNADILKESLLNNGKDFKVNVFLKNSEKSINVPLNLVLDYLIIWKTQYEVIKWKTEFEVEKDVDGNEKYEEDISGKYKLYKVKTLCIKEI